MTPENRDEYRRQIVRRLENQDHDLEAKAEKAEAEAAQARMKRKKLEAALLRAQGPPRPSNECEACWIIHGRHSQMVAAEHEDPDHFDRLECKTCGHFEDIELGR